MHCIDMQIHIATLVEGSLAVFVRADKRHLTCVDTNMREQFVDTLEHLHAMFFLNGLISTWINSVEERYRYTPQVSLFNKLNRFCICVGCSIYAVINALCSYFWAAPLIGLLQLSFWSYMISTLMMELVAETLKISFELKLLGVHENNNEVFTTVWYLKLLSSESTLKFALELIEFSHLLSALVSVYFGIPLCIDSQLLITWIKRP